MVEYIGKVGLELMLFIIYFDKCKFILKIVRVEMGFVRKGNINVLLI